MNKPSREEIMQMNGDQLDYFLNECLVPFFARSRMGNRARHYSFNPVDAADAKAALRKLGFRFKFAEFITGCSAAFSREQLAPGEYFVSGHATEELATARAAAITIVVMTDLFEQAHSQ